MMTLLITQQEAHGQQNSASTETTHSTGSTYACYLSTHIMAVALTGKLSKNNDHNSYFYSLKTNTKSKLQHLVNPP